MMREMARRVRSAYTGLRYPFWVPPGHFYSPLTSTADISRVLTKKNYDEPLRGIDLRDVKQRELAKVLAELWPDVPTVPDPEWRYSPRNSMFGLADAAIYYSILRYFRPRRVIEVGSGFSSAIALDTADRYLPDLELTFIEPYPERLLGLIRKSDKDRCKILTVPVQDVPTDIYGQLSSGDVLFVDSTHVSKPGSDVNWLLFEVLPCLAEGVYVHFHDVFWPFEYPREWILQGRCWTEDYILRAFLSYNHVFGIEFFASWLWGADPQLVRKALPTALEDQPGSLWLRKLKVS